MNVCLHGKICKNKKDDLSKKDHLRTLFVEIPSYYSEGQRTGLPFRFCPAKSDSIPANQTNSILLFYSHNPVCFLFFCFF